MKILLVEDDPGIIAGLVAHLGREGFAVQPAPSLCEARAALHTFCPDLVLLDRMLPDGDGLSWLREARASGFGKPVIVLTAKADVFDKVLGLDLGADDYLAKPFEPAELLARMRVQLRARGAIDSPDAEVIQCGQLRLDNVTHEIFLGDNAVAFAPMEFRLLHFFLKNQRRALSRETLLQKVWGTRFGSTRTVDVHVAQLRQKLVAEWFQTLHGVGYRFVCKNDDN